MSEKLFNRGASTVSGTLDSKASITAALSNSGVSFGEC